MWRHSVVSILPADSGAQLQVLWITDEFVQDTDNQGEARPLVAVPLPAVQHELV